MCMREREGEGERESDIPTDNPIDGVVCDLESRADMQPLWCVKWRGMAVIDGDGHCGDGKQTLANLPARVDPRHPCHQFHYINDHHHPANKGHRHEI